MAFKMDVQPYCAESHDDSGWAVLIESHSLNFAELNSLNYHSLAWSMVKGKPLIYNQIEQLIHYGFKQFIIGLYHIDQLVRQQIQQLESLYNGCIFKCTQVKDSLFFEQGEGLSPQGEIYLQRYMAVYLANNLNHHSPKPMCIWIQKIQIDCINPFNYLNIGLTHLNTNIIVKTDTHPNKLEAVYGFWLDINSLAARYKKLSNSDQHLAQGERIRQCFNDINQHAQQLLINPKDLTASTVQHEEDGIVASRCFNQVTIDTDMGIVMKQSTDIKKLKQEIDFYKNLPDDLQIYFPRFIESKINQKNAWYSL